MSDEDDEKDDDGKPAKIALPDAFTTKLRIRICAWRSCQFRVSARSVNAQDAAMADHVVEAHSGLRPS